MQSWLYVTQERDRELERDIFDIRNTHGIYVVQFQTAPLNTCMHNNN